jgi:hypothetical protein
MFRANALTVMIASTIRLPINADMPAKHPENPLQTKATLILQTFFCNFAQQNRMSSPLAA